MKRSRVREDCEMVTGTMKPLEWREMSQIWRNVHPVVITCVEIRLSDITRKVNDPAPSRTLLKLSNKFLNNSTQKT